MLLLSCFVLPLWAAHIKLHIQLRNAQTYREVERQVSNYLQSDHDIVHISKVALHQMIKIGTINIQTSTTYNGISTALVDFQANLQHQLKDWNPTLDLQPAMQDVCEVAMQRAPDLLLQQMTLNTFRWQALADDLREFKQHLQTTVPLCPHLNYGKLFTSIMNKSMDLLADNIAQEGSVDTPLRNYQTIVPTLRLLAKDIDQISGSNCLAMVNEYIQLYL